jgi:hypothetical protein
MSHGTSYSGWGVQVDERVSRRRAEAATLISTLGCLLDVWVTPKELQWEDQWDTPSYLHRGVRLAHTSYVFDGDEAPTDYLAGSMPCACGGKIFSGYISEESDITALLEGRDPIAVEHRCTSEVIRNVGDSCPTCAHRLSPSHPSIIECQYCGFQVYVEDDGSVVRENGSGTYFIRLYDSVFRGTVGRFGEHENFDQWMSEVQASGSTVERAYYTRDDDGVWETVYVVGSPDEYDWTSPTTQVPGPAPDLIAWPA